MFAFPGYFRATHVSLHMAYAHLGRLRSHRWSSEENFDIDSGELSVGSFEADQSELPDSEKEADAHHIWTGR